MDIFADDQDVHARILRKKNRLAILSWLNEFRGTVTSDSSPCAFLVFACLIELHQTRGTRRDAVFATLLRLRGHCLAPANAEATAHCAQPPISV